MSTYSTSIIDNTARHVQNLLTGEGSGHDWWHIRRVWRTAKALAEEEQADMFVVELAALLHDIGDHKFHNGDETMGAKLSRAWMEQQQVPESKIVRVCQVIDEVSFKGAGTSSAVSSLEAQVVQDADRLDAIGAIGIARAFAYGGHKGREMHNPAVAPVLHTSFEEYKKNSGPTLNHFYEKLFLLKDRMHTASARRLAAKRHDFMDEFVTRFLAEWDGER
ncbi:HD domain-containing protein [Pontibacter sp. SGAir0037]|uniref:HD domain-containing protein n=1 Tax=Pontibacter sp. SGAir0037 TaxID=2571030 RepID=UPI0010CCD3FC|nr:HD domain-containing protein [Pontibacter sp. SGAir0037]QCR22193.1 phosphohydrolase [Pontibacter sp. SGAir0037]